MITRSSLSLIALLAAGSAAFAQQDAQYAQFTHDKLNFNPAYAGAKGGTTVGLIARAQWVGIEGAPTSQALRAHVPLEDSRVGLGVSIDNDVIGFGRSTGIKAAYSYRIQINRELFLNLGMDASMRQIRLDYTDARREDLVDGTLTENPVSTRYLPNVGAGGFLYGERFYLGLSIPRLAEGIVFAPEGGRFTGLSREARHAYLMGGVDLPAGRHVRIRPALNVKYTANAPVSFDLNAMTVLRETLAVGAGYRGGGLDSALEPAALDAIIQVMPRRELTIGMAYGYPLSELAGQQAGSFEVLLEYTFLRARGIKCYYF